MTFQTRSASASPLTAAAVAKGAAGIGVALCALLVSGCSGSTASPASHSAAGASLTLTATRTGGAPHATTLDPCVLLRRSDVLAGLGGTVSAGNSHDPNITDGPSCEYEVTGSAVLGEPGGVFVELTTGLAPSAVREGAKHPLGTEVTVDGVGDAATYDPAEDGLNFVKNNHTILVEPILHDSMKTPHPAQTKAAIIALARVVANRA